MHKAVMFSAIAAMIAAPAQAQHWQVDEVASRPGGFVGARLRLPVGDAAGAKPKAQLAIAPTRSGIDAAGMVRTKVGEGVALDFAARRPSLSIAGVPAKRLPSRQKLGISTVALVGIGVAVVAVGGFLLWADDVRDSGD